MIRIEHFEAFRFDLKTRMPFRYGIATMTDLPHLFIRLKVSYDGRSAAGWAADHLPPKWFKKDPDQHPIDEVNEMLQVIHQAAESAVGCEAESAFDWWRQAYDRQMKWASDQSIPPLLAHFGVSLIERACIDAICRIQNKSIHQALVDGDLGFNPAAFQDLNPFKSVPTPWSLSPPLNSCDLRHTVGLSDPIFESEVNADEYPTEDGLPISLQSVIQNYGVSHLKIKISGDSEADHHRLESIAACLRESRLSTFAYSLDGNEQFPTMDAFSEAWSQLNAESSFFKLGGTLLWIEQPVHRSKALDETGGRADQLAEGPPVIIDESDAELDSLSQAIELGYAGTSHKNCKGVFKGLHHAFYLAGLKAAHPQRPAVMSGEDLSTVGPISLLQDLAVQSLLGIQSVERNGHHYFLGLSQFPEAFNRAIIEGHPDLFQWDSGGQFAKLNIQEGKLALRSVISAPFGSAREFAPAPENRCMEIG